MDSLTKLIQWLLVLSSISSATVCGAPWKLTARREGVFGDRPLSRTTYVKDNLKTYYYPQTIDHFNYKPESYMTFNQRYIIDDQYWGGAKTNAPIFVYFGEEGPLDSDLQVIGFLNENAPHFKALIVYIEHRFYGKTKPFGLTMAQALKNATVRGYFNSAQAVEDYAEVMLYLKKDLKAPHSPIIVIGGSYGGMLASWFRLKYPHIALGALASSAPILYFLGVAPKEGYYSVVSKDFKDASENCYHTIKKSWSKIDELATKKPNGLSILSQKFKTCKPLTDVYDLTNYLDTTFASAAQYNDPPNYPVTVICRGIDEAPKGTYIIGQVAAGIFALKKNKPCIDIDEYDKPNDETNLGWPWQTCSDMVIPIEIDNDSMMPPYPFNLTDYVQYCVDLYGVSPRPHWITTYFGGQDIKLVLKRFGSNIIFSNGLRDPYSSGGILENISKSIVAIHTKEGPHCLDIVVSREDDPKWLIKQRRKEVKVIEKWLKKYYKDLQKAKLISPMVSPLLSGHNEYND